MRISLIELKNVLYNFEWLKLLQLKLKLVNIVLFYLLVKNVHYIHKPDAVDSQLIAIDLTILNCSKKVRSLKLNYIFPLICHYRTNFIKVQFFRMENMQRYHVYQTWPRRILSPRDNDLKPDVMNRNQRFDISLDAWWNASVAHNEPECLCLEHWKERSINFRLSFLTSGTSRF